MTETMLKLTAVLAISALTSIACTAAGEHLPQDGDIIFHTSRSAQSDAIQKATGSRYSHMGIIYLRAGEPFVLEAVEPVRFTPLGDWIARGNRHHYVVKRLANAGEVITPDALRHMHEAGRDLLGKRYDLYFEWSDERIYCSELVWKVYERALGIEIGEVQTLGTFDLSDPVVQAKARERWQGSPPLQEKVISPAAIFASDRLVTVFESPATGPTGGPKAALTGSRPPTGSNPATQIDHLILAIDDLTSGIDEFQKLTGVRAAVGGRHPHIGTHNALIALGPRLYLELLAPHPEMELVDGMGWLRDVETLEPMGWAASTSDIEDLINALRDQGYGTTAGSPGSRARPDGATLNWTTMGLTSPAIPAAPFFIEWGATTEHPATTSPAGCTLDALVMTAPDPEPLRRLLDLLQLDVTVERSDSPGPSMAIALNCPNGPIEFEGFAGTLSAAD